MKAGNDNRVVLLGLDGTPWGVALGHDCKDEHVGACFGLCDWLDIPDGAVTVEDAMGRATAPGHDWAFVRHDDPKLATLLVLNDPDAPDWRLKRMAVRLADVRSGEGFHGAEQEDDALVTAYDRQGAALAAFRAADRRLLTDLAEALGKGRLAVASGNATGTGMALGPILILADRVPENAFLQAIADVAGVLSFDDEGTGIAYAMHPAHRLETCTVRGPAR